MKKLLISFMCVFFFLSSTFASNSDQDAATKWAEILNKIEIDFDREEYDNYIYDTLYSLVNDVQWKKYELILKELLWKTNNLLTEKKKQAYYNRGRILELETIKKRVIKLQIISENLIIILYMDELDEIFDNLLWEEK